MRRIIKPVAFVSCLCLLMLQWSGLHVHANETGYIGGPETSSTHSHVHHDHHGAQISEDREAAPGDPNTDDDYGDAHDVSLLHQALVAFKLPLAILALILLVGVFPLIGALAGPEIAYRVLSGRHTRWRPPLRAPPRSATNLANV
jgi:hypothetical protein